MGFNQVWINLLMLCITNVNYKISLEQELLGLISPNHGLRQGCPLFPYLYLLCAALLKEKTQCGNLHGIQICRGALVIDRRFFADDYYLFFKATLDDAAAISSVLYEYEKNSGQAINLSKLEILFSPNVRPETRLEICECLNIAEVNDPGDYLGLSTFIGANKKKMFTVIKDRVWK